MKHGRRGRWAFGFTAAAFCWALAIIPAAFLLPVYSTETITNAFPPSAGTTIDGGQHGGATLIAVNGASARLLILLTLPAALAGVVWFALHRSCARGSAIARRVASAVLGLLAALALLTGFSIGGEILPVFVLLLIARSLTPTDGKHAAREVQRC